MQMFTAKIRMPHKRAIRVYTVIAEASDEANRLLWKKTTSPDDMILDFHFVQDMPEVTTSSIHETASIMED